ncbi:Retrotransposon-like protein 1 [Strongyloides ratti]|uniref:Retrotransposon-like protein 1 n=1 Tax=Strongyloides ratti TaxID=34506 RepID=A0A090KVM6_STRRB|nr:Retrotransposon-like protein 1 [Strongyloides ratti]CEF61476.1 Retrotransposon-like protein 1 [Strongyloides ratti]
MSWQINAYCLTNEFNLNINNTPTNCLLDSGANVSLISSNYCKHSNLKIQLTHVNIKDASNNPMHIDAKITLTLDGEPFTVFVAKDLIYDMIVETDIIMKSHLIFEKFTTLLRPAVNAVNFNDTLENLIKQNEKAFSKITHQLGKRPTPLALREIVKKKIDEMLLHKIIWSSNSPWSAPLQIVAKGEKDVRLCVNYRKLNRIIKLDAYSLPNMQLFLQNLHDRTVFSNIDLTKRYWQVGLTEESKQYTAFSCDLGLF